MNINYTTVGWTAAVLFLVCAVGFANHRAHASPSGSGQYQHRMGHGLGPHKLFKMIHHLDLSRQQREQIGQVMDKHRPQMRTFMLDMMDAKKALQAILNDPNYDAQAIESLAQTQAANAEKMFLNTAAVFAQIGGLLTAEQRKQVSERMDKRGRWGKHGGHHKDGPRHGPRDSTNAEANGPESL